MITLTWVESEIKKAVSERPTAQAVYDLAASITVRDYLRALTADQESAEAPEPKPATVNMLDYCADLDKCPTLDQVETALGSVAIHSQDEAKRAKDARTWADILRR